MVRFKQNSIIITEVIFCEMLRSIFHSDNSVCVNDNACKDCDEEKDKEEIIDG